MKRTSRILISVFLCSFLTCTVLAQERDLNSDQLRVKIAEFEKTEFASTSAIVRGIYERTLLRLYNQYNAALKQDITALKTIQAALGGADKQSQDEITSQLRKLSLEESLTTEKIKTLTGDLKTGASEPTIPTPGPGVGRNFQAGTGSDSTTVPRQVTGRVTAINEQIFTNAYKFSSEEIRQAVQRVSAIRSGALKTTDAVQGVPLIEREDTKAIVNKAHASPPQAPQGNLILKANHIGALDTPLAEVFVRVEKPGDNNFTAQEFLTDSQGNFTTSALGAGSYVFSVKVSTFKTSVPVTIAAGQGTPAANLQLLVRPLGEFARAIVGFEQAGASAAKSTQKYFFDLTLSHPLPFQKSVHPYFGPRGRAWGTVRVTSVPQQITSSVGTFATGFAQQVSEVKVNEVAQAVEFLAGVDIRLTNKFLSFGSFGGQTATKATLSFIAGGGAITPFTPRETLEIFKAFPGAPGLPPLPDGTEFVAFVSPDRDRFFRQFYAGLRLQTHYFDYKNPDIPLNRYPGTLDITYGQNEAVTGGRLHGGVIRLEGFYPLPYSELSFIHLFGTALIRPVRSKITDPLILQTAPADTVVPAANVFMITVPQINRDYYRVGVGIDFIELVKKWGAGQSNP